MLETMFGENSKSMFPPSNGKNYTFLNSADEIDPYTAPIQGKKEAT